MTSNSLPDMYHFTAFNADPNDPLAIPYWTDFRPYTLGWDNYQRGRQYELARTMGADPKLEFRDVNEYLNAANTSSPYYPLVQPYRSHLVKAVWPTAPGANSNLLNLNNWRVPVDGSFESYTVGSTPAFITAYTSAPTVTTTNPQAGTKSLTYPTGADPATRYGIQFTLPTIPGQQYTASAYVRQTTASTQIVRISDQTQANDWFNRTTASGFGVAPLGGTWVNTTGLASERSTSPATAYSAGYGQVAVAAVNSNRWQTLPIASRDVRVRATVTPTVIAAGGEIQAGVVARWSSSGANCYEAVLIFGTDRSVTLRIGRRVASVFTSLDSVRLDGVLYSPGDVFMIDFRVTGTDLRANAWRSNQTAPEDLTVSSMVGATDTSISGTGDVGTFCWLHASNTNTLPVSVRFGTFSTVGAAEGSTTSATGSYQRLSITFTATQPTHIMTITNVVGAAVAGTVNVDSIMLNTGAAAGTFSSTGSVIYPVMRPAVERWTRTWQSAGFEGYSDVPCVDGLAALQAIAVPPPVDGQIARMSPDYWWALDGGPDATVFPEISGNAGPSLGLNISKYGVGTLPAGGTLIDIPGGGGATGVTFTPPSPATGSTLAGTSIGCGPLADDPAQPFRLPALISATEPWAVTVAMWVQATDSGASQTAIYPSKQIGGTRAYIPIYMDIDGGVGTAIQNVTAPAGATTLLSSGDGISGINLLDGLPHLLVGIVSQDPLGDTFVFRYIDDVLDGSNSATTASLGVLNGYTDSLSIGATDDGARFLAIANGTISRVCIWNREVNPGELTDLYLAGLGWAGDTSGQRLARDLEDAGYVGDTRISNSSPTLVTTPGDPVTTMQAPSWTAPYSAQSDLVAITEAEQGCSWVAADGALVFEGREDRFLRLTPTWYLGENEAGGEAPYLEGVEFDYDPAFVYANVSVRRPGGATLVGGSGADIAQAARRFYPRAYGLTADFADDQQAQGAADWIFYSHRAPNLRVAEIELDPASNPDLWPLVLGIEVGQRVRVIRRAKAANGGAGLTMSADFFVENVGHRGVRYDRGTWRTPLLLSPIGSAPGATVQPWILEDTTYSVLGTTTVLGF